MKPKKLVGVVLTGGGARGAYQAGVLKGVCEIANKIGITYPFSIFSGISVGAINSALLASHAEDVLRASDKLVDIWNHLRTNNVIHTSAVELSKAASRLLLELTSGKMIKKKKARSLLDNSPLSKLLTKEINFPNIEKYIHKGYLKSLVVTAVNYADGKNYIFFQADEKVEPWIREHRVVKQTTITMDHVLASSAIPLYFPPQKIGNHYFADGNIRNNFPLSPPIRLGAEKLLVVPVTDKEVSVGEQEAFDPTLGRMITVLLNALLLDAVDIDLERLSRINGTLKLLPLGSQTPLKKIDVCMIRPSASILEIAQENLKVMPAPLRYLLEGLGSPAEVAGLASTLLFEPPFTKELMALGYADAKRQKEEIVQFFSIGIS